MTTALLRTLQLTGVKFLRYMTVDVCNSIRCKAVPLDHLLLQYPPRREIGTEQQYHHPVHSAAVSIAQVCMAGLPSFGDLVLADATGLNAQDVLVIHPDWSTLRVLPYAPKSAVVLGTLHHPPKPAALRQPGDGSMSPLCTRGLLQRVVETAELDHDIGFVCI
jgi:glutamine synthetase